MNFKEEYNNPLDKLNRVIFLPGDFKFILKPTNTTLDVGGKNLYYNLTIPKNKIYISCYGNKISNIDLHNNIKIIHADMFTELNNINNKQLEINFW